MKILKGAIAKYQNIKLRPRKILKRPCSISNKMFQLDLWFLAIPLVCTMRSVTKHSMNWQWDLCLHQEWTSPWWGSRSCPWWPRRRGWAWGSCRGRQRTRRTRRSACSHTPCKILRRGQPQLLIYYVKKWSACSLIILNGGGKCQ